MSTPATNQVRILLVDDHTILRQGLRQLLEADARLSVCSEAGDGEAAVVQALSLKPDVILMDINMPKVNGFEASRALLAAWPDAKIIVLTNQDDPMVLKKFVDLNIRGIFLKDVAIEPLIEAIFTVVNDPTETIIAPELLEKIHQLPKQAGKSGGVFDLTEREREVLRALTKGYSNQQLADLLVVSPKTVHNHLYNIYSKIGVASRTEAIVWAIESGFLDS